ncbi:phage tail protein [Salmonella enterica subsp. enterica]|nr:phage tail protein [Salmonella enterica subsp. enterica serovar Wandsworth]MDJ6233624.1 phage tail protein [Salmonella enterica]EDT6630817.1 phage tail protein [Salmonella enterica subsp. enterica serovar Wandsworth]EDT6698656.1 phage tail protein [Salmonella enterica subsp. enterica serovar Wandsworth]EDT6704171.1 phage tail protein [Salmonella enterica subsp. enterica serovar Wandsworth]
MADYYSIITNRGKELEAEALASGRLIVLTHFVVGDSNGKQVRPDPAQIRLINETYRGDIAELVVSPEQSTQLMAKIVLPTGIGGFTVREVGLMTDAGDLYAVANCPPIDKPVGGVSVNMQFRLAVSDTSNITLNVATGDGLFLRIDQNLKEIKSRGAEAQKTSRESIGVLDGTTQQRGLVQLSSSVNSTSETQAATPAAVKIVMDNANARLAKDRNGADIPNVALFLQNLGLEETINLAKNAVPATRRINSKPLSGDITLWASDVGAISADAVGEITDNGTMASANTPGWWRVSVSNSDSVADFPTYPDGSKLYSYGYLFVEKIGEVWFQHYYAHMGANAKRQDWGTVPNTSRPWIVDYNTANKPTANDVQALPIAGGRLNGPLGIGTDNALGGNSIVLGDNDTGIKQNGDGVLDIYANSAHVLRFISSLVESMVSLKVNGNAVATGEVQAGNGSSRMTNNGDIFGSVWGNSWLSLWINNNFVADVQLGAGTSVTTWNNAGSWPNTPGYVVTSVWKDNQGENIDGIAYAPLQKRVGSQWYTVQGGTA